MAGNSILTIEGNAARAPEVKKLGNSEYYTWSIAVHEARDTDRAPTWYTVHVFKDNRSEKVIPLVDKGTYMRVTGVLKVRQNPGQNAFLDVYVPLEMFGFMGKPNSVGASNGTYAPRGKQGDEPSVPAQAAHDDGEDIPF